MTKFIKLLVAVMAVVMVVCSCTPAGAPIGIVGTWEPEDATLYTIEIKNDDTVWGEIIGVSTKLAIITKATCDKMTVEILLPVKKTEEWKYELVGDKLSITDASDKTTKYNRKK